MFYYISFIWGLLFNTYVVYVNILFIPFNRGCPFLGFLLKIYAFSFVETTTVSAPSFFLASPVYTINDNNGTACIY